MTNIFNHYWSDWAALKEGVLLSASKVVQENPLTTVDGIEIASDRQTNTSLVARPFLSFATLCSWIGFEVRFVK